MMYLGDKHDLKVVLRDKDLLRIFLRDFYGGFFGRIFFGRIFLGGFFGRIFLEDFFGGFFGRIFWEDFLGEILCYIKVS